MTGWRCSAFLTLSVPLLLGGCSGGGGDDSPFGGITVSARAQSASTIALSWNRPEANSDSSFVVERNDAGHTGEIARTSLPSWVVRRLDPETQYCFVVRFFTLLGSRSSNTACATTLADNAPPTVPSGLTATAVSPIEVGLSWEAASDDHRVEGYNVFRDGVFLTTTDTVAVADAEAVPGALHCYGVSAYDPSGNESARSAEACVTAADTEDPSAPTALSASFSRVDGQSRIALIWTESVDDGRIETYRIFRDGTYLAASSTASYDDFVLEAETSYCYTVSAVDAVDKESAQSEPACARASWTAMMLAPSGRWVDMALDTDDIPHIAFKHTSNAGVVLEYASAPPGLAPVVEVLDEGEESFGLSVAIAVDTSQLVHIAHKTKRSPYPEAIEHLQLAPPYTQVNTVQQSDMTMLAIALGADSTGVLHACYDLRGRLVYANNGSGVWLPTDVDTLVGVAGGWNCDIAVGPDDSIHISFIQPSSRELIYLSNQSGDWALERLDQDSGNTTSNYDTSIAVDAAGNAHIAYFNDYTEYDLEYASNASGSWVTSKIDTAGMVGSAASIAVDQNGFVHIVYHDSPASGVLKYATNVSGAWHTDFLAAAGGGETAIAVDSLGKVHVAFSSNDYSLTYMTNRAP